MSAPDSLRLKKSNAVWLGVCSGIAQWLDVPAALVRTIFVIGVLLWPSLFLAYFVLWFCMDRDLFRDRTWDNLDPSRASAHFRSLDYRKPIHRNTRDKRLAGVCAGVADYLEVSPFWIRLLTVLSLFVFGPFTVFGYIVCIFLLDPDPFLEDERRRRRSRRRSRGRRAEPEADADSAAGMAATRPGREGGKTETCAASFRDLEKRLREIEAYMTSKRFRLHCEIKRA
ncbi:MAG: PspC domain-containing protein [Gammaproteobacteria bacterium]|nr:PspC domain-containing protein [Gammaproteobacteria bacterium]MCY4181264.1 PspC domain-containing protein [Gammaproteobacteria bacterium]